MTDLELMETDRVGEWPDPLKGRLEGTCVLANPAAGIWWVRGRTTTYTCSAQRNECTCLDFIHRRAMARTPCRHLRALEHYLTLTPCPCCEEQGCAACLNLGRVTAEEGEALMEVSLAPKPTDEELRTIFQ